MAKATETPTTSPRGLVAAFAVAPIIGAVALPAVFATMPSVANAAQTAGHADLSLIEAAAEYKAAWQRILRLFDISNNDKDLGVISDADNELDRVSDRMSEIATMMIGIDAQSIAGVHAKADVLQLMIERDMNGEISQLASREEFVAWSLVDDLRRLLPGA